MEQQDYLTSHMEDLADKAIKTGVAASRFLTPAEVQHIRNGFSRRDEVLLSFDGGYGGSERVRAVFLNASWGEYDKGKLFTALKIECRPQETLGHRNVLGSVMALGIERNTVGDIIARDHYVILLCLPEIGGYIAEGLLKVGPVGVNVSEIGLDEIPVRQDEYSVITDTVASLRLDSLLSAAFGLSRAKSVELIKSGHVNLDHQLCQQPAKELNDGSLISARGYGRAKLLEVGGMSKKGRLFVKIGLYK